MYTLLNYFVLITELLNTQYFQEWIQIKGTAVWVVFLLIGHKKIYKKVKNKIYIILIA